MFNQSKYLSRGIILILAVIAGISVFLLIRDQQFRLVKSTPSRSGTVSTSTNGFELFFNKDLDGSADYSKSITDPGHLVGRIRLDKRSIIIETGPILQDKKYSFSLHDIHDAKGDVIKEIKFDFTAKYLPDSKISDEQKSLIAKLSRQYLQDYPLLAHLPYSTLDYSLEAVFNQDENQRLGQPEIQAKLFLSHADMSEPRAATARYKQEVIDYITSLGLNPSDYKINYLVIQSSG